MLHVSPSMFARLIEDSDSVQLNAVSSSMKQKRTESQANMQPIQFAIDVNTRASAVQRKLSSDLLVRSVYYHNSITSTPTKAMLNSAIQATANEMVNSEITCEVSDRLLARIVELGGRVVSSSSRFGSIHAFLPLAALEILGKDEAVKRIREAHKPMLNKVNTSEGDISHRAASARSAYNVTGAGIKIGVISDSVRYLSQIQSSGDLPSNVTVLPGLSGIQDDESDIGEGTAMLEIVHDLCPGASLYFATAGVTEAEMAESIIALKNAGCDIIVDDVCFRTESAFQDGIISSAVKDVYDSGKIYVTCAANKGNYDSGYSGVWEGDFNPSSQTVTLGGVEYEQHEFPDGSTGNLINYWSANNVYTLQWSDPLGASGNDYELAVYDYDTGTWLQKSGDEQNGDDDPYDWCRITSSMATHAGLGLRVLKKKGAANRFIRIAAFNQATGSKGRGRLEMSTPGMVYGHNASPYAISVAATEYVANRAFVSTDAIAYYSSDGPRKMFYDITGTSYTTSKLASGGRLFNKPDFAAASTVSCATPDFEEFGGTSAAAPHIAAICGLMLHANQDLTQSEVVNIMSSSTVSPYSGWNRTYGYGMVNAVECVRLAKESASGPSPNLEINIASGTTSGSCTVENDGSSWKIVEAFPSWVKGITFYCPANGNVMSLASNGTSIGFSGEATMTVNCTTNDTGSARTWDMSISNRTTRAIQYRIHVVQSPHVAVSPPSAPTLTGISTYGLYARTDYIEVGWSAAARATSYNVYRNTSSSTSGRTKVASNVTSPYRDYVSNGLTPGVKYWYWVEAVNSAGSTFSVSDWGNILVSALLSKTTLGFTAAGGTSNITVTANTSWSASTSASWLSLSTSGTSGNGSIAVTAAPNANTSSRSGYVIATAGAGTSYPKVVTNVVTQAAGMTLQTALDSTTLSFTSGGGSSWFGQTTITHDGVDAVQSGALGNSQTNWLQTTVTGPGTISFWWYASSEQNWDFLEFMIDGDVVGSMSGTNNVWTSKSFEISTSGTHTLLWRYRKDGSQYRGLDAGFVDQVTWTPSVVSAPVWTINAAGTLTAVELNGCTDIAIPEGVKSMSSYVFRELPVTSVRFPSTLQSVGVYAFYECTSLTNVTFSTGLTKIDMWAFCFCTSLTGVFEIPEGVAEVAFGAFMGTGVRTLVFPSTLQKLGPQQTVFGTPLTSVYFKGNAPELEGDDRTNSPYCDALSSLVTYVRPGTTGWQDATAALPETWPTSEARPIRNYSGEPPRGTSGVVPSTSPTPITYNVTYLPGSYASGSTYTATKTNDVALVLRGSTYTRTGYTQTGWSTSSAGTSKSYNLSASYTANSAITLYPYWTPNTYSVTYALNGGTHGATHPTTATYDSAFYVSAPTKSGYTFTGWTVTSGLNTSTAKWGTTSSPSTSLTSSTTKCANGATGNVYFKNLTSTSSGSVTLTANWTPVTALPDLCPYTPAGWSGSLVLSTESQNATNSTATSFSPNDAIYVSLAVVNLGVGFSDDFNWALYVDDSLRTTGANWGSGLAANGYSRWFALPIGPLPPGTHTIKVMYDYAGRLDESDESNNTVTRTVIVSGTVVRPSNDNFAGAATISGMSGSVTGSNVNATRESGEPLPSTSAGATNTIWWTWTAPATGIAQFSTAGSKVSYTAMGAYVGSSVSGLTTVSASADSYSQSSISFSVVSGTRYYIAVSGTGYRYQGTIKLNWSMFTPVPLNTALDNASQTFTTGGAANWVGVSDESYYGGSSARSGAISHSQTTWLQTEVTGEGTLSFWYKVSSESGWDKLIFYVDGVQKTTASGTVGWSRFECVISNNTQHVVKWTYSKDGLGSTGSDCCWVDKVEWTPSGVVVDVGGGETVTVPRTWIEAHRTFVATLGANDEEAVTNGTAANGRKVWECYVLGLDPGDATDDFRIVSFPIKADGTPDLTNIVFEPARGRWNVPDAQVVVKGAATLDGPWDDVPSGGNSTFRFFKVVVALP